MVEIAFYDEPKIESRVLINTIFNISHIEKSIFCHYWLSTYLTMEYWTFSSSVLVWRGYRGEN